MLTKSNSACFLCPLSGVGWFSLILPDPCSACIMLTRIVPLRQLMGISVRMCLKPLPDVGDHRSEVGLCGKPAQFVPDLLTGSDEDGWVSSTPGSRSSIDGPLGYVACRLDHLANRESFAISKIVDPMLPSLDTL